VRHRFPLPAALAFEEHCYSLGISIAAPVIALFLQGSRGDMGGEEGTSCDQRELAQRASVLGAMLEDQEARWLRGEPVQLAEFCTLVNAQRRVLADIGLEREAREVVPLTEYIAQRSQEKSKRRLPSRLRVPRLPWLSRLRLRQLLFWRLWRLRRLRRRQLVLD
jgi:hypothetical protein